jgi:hypothetical protein
MPELPYSPRFTKATRALTRRVGDYECTLLKNIEGSGVQYLYILEVLKEGDLHPCSYVASEVNQMSSLGGGSHILGNFQDKGHANLGSSDDWADETKFVAKALSIVAERYGVPTERSESEPTARKGHRDGRKGGWRAPQQMDMSPCMRAPSPTGTISYRSARPIGPMVGAALFGILFCAYAGMFVVNGVSMSPEPTRWSQAAPAKRYTRPIALSVILAALAISCGLRARRSRYELSLEADCCVVRKGKEKQIFGYDEIHSVLVTSTLSVEQRGRSSVQIPGWQVVAQLSPSVSMRVFRSPDQESSMTFGKKLASELRCPDRLRVSDVHARI